jgi:hypothetical protein
LERESRSVKVIFQVVRLEAVEDIGLPPGTETEMGIGGRDKICWRVMEDSMGTYGIVLTSTNELEGMPTFNAIFEETGLERFGEMEDNTLGISHELDDGIEVEENPTGDTNR